MSKHEIMDESEIKEVVKKFNERLKKAGEAEAKNLTAASIEPLATEETAGNEAKRLQEGHINKNSVN